LISLLERLRIDTGAVIVQHDDAKIRPDHVDTRERIARFVRARAIT
jgi:hypothetical protein